jgi:sugar phosphate isomerase/epimerase
MLRRGYSDGHADPKLILQGAAMLSIATDFAADTGCPKADLQAIAQAGFSHVHWCHQWNKDFIYHRSEIEQIGQWLKDFGLKLADLHGSQGQEKDWTAPQEYRRLAGVELVANRVEMTAELGGDAVVMHMLPEPLEAAANVAYWRGAHHTLDALADVCRRNKVRLAIENVGKADPGCAYCFDTIAKVFARHGPDVVGLCYDCGHGNFAGDGLDQLDCHKDRLAVLHLHDNDGTRDQHRLPFTGTVDWPRLTRLIAQSAYRKGVTLEVGMRNNDFTEPAPFLARALAAAGKIDEMIQSQGRK